MTSCNTCIAHFHEDPSITDNCIGCADCNKWAPSDSFKIREYDRLREIEDKYDAMPDRARYVVVTQEYINCPSCEGADGSPRMRSYQSIGDIIEMVADTCHEQELMSVFDLDTDAEIGSVSWQVHFGGHSVRYVKFDFNSENNLVCGPWCISAKTNGGSASVRDKDDCLLTDEDRKERLKLLN